MICKHLFPLLSIYAFPKGYHSLCQAMFLREEKKPKELSFYKKWFLFQPSIFNCYTWMLITKVNHINGGKENIDFILF